jgi:Meckel syndrome type 1 protein
MTANTYDNERETLSALFDGELQDDAARFAFKRLGHDEQWRSAFGRWQLCGDVLRGQAHGVAAGDFAQRVSAAIALEAPMEAPSEASAAPLGAPAAALRVPTRSSRRGWIGGALAASVAVVALFVARPLTNGSAPVADSAPAQVADAGPAAAASTTATVTSATAATAPAAPRSPVAPDGAVDLGTAAVAAAEVPRRAIERRSTRSQNQRAALRASGRRESVPVAVATAATQAPVTAIAASEPAIEGGNAQATNPFRPQHSEAAARPWPRAVLPQYPASGGLTASYGTASSPSFYPFEPSMPQETATRDAERAAPLP